MLCLYILILIGYTTYKDKSLCVSLCLIIDIYLTGKLIDTENIILRKQYQKIVVSSIVVSSIALGQFITTCVITVLNILISESAQE